MKKSHGPSLKATPIPLKWCPICKGKAVTKRVFHELPCTECHASGWVSAETGEPLPVEILVTQLGLMLNIYQQRIITLERDWPRASSAADQYSQNNRRGAGGTNYTGD
ncbi:hypothetical protein PS870_06436 [Pseudomonas fluorescens]|uniref:Prophage PssSM-03 n=1 Tax=Pseudomonas fluorescens TaxID=294 RepID=A0A5E7QHR3_PSEFL|nr:hypothetical protein [Pseudomonas fluorescens]VVP61756.1 hypothetical protein PS870_06436 [Pseudomonas fluorescens]